MHQVVQKLSGEDELTFVGRQLIGGEEVCERGSDDEDDVKRFLDLSVNPPQSVVCARVPQQLIVGNRYSILLKEASKPGHGLLVLSYQPPLVLLKLHNLLLILNTSIFIYDPLNFCIFLWILGIEECHFVNLTEGGVLVGLRAGQRRGRR